MMLRFSAAAAGIILAASCAEVPPTERSAAMTCPVTNSQGWAAWVNAMPGPDARVMLVVTGEVIVPTEGHSAQLQLGPVGQADPPIQEVLLKVTPSQGGANLASTALKVRGEFPALASYERVVVKCGSRILAEIAPVEKVY